jgi:hypothetical protein
MDLSARQCDTRFAKRHSRIACFSTTAHDRRIDHCDASGADSFLLKHTTLYSA